MSHQTDHQQAATVAPKNGNSGVFTVPTARFRVRKGSNRIEMIVRLLGKDANAKATNIQLKNGEQLNTKTHEITGNPHATAYLRKLRNELDELFYKLDREGQEFTAQDLSDYLFKKRDWRTHKPHVLGVIAAYNEHRKPEVEAGLLTETVFERFGRMERIMKGFLMHQYKTDVVTLESLKPVFAKELEAYFKTVQKYDNATYVKYIRHYKSVLDYAVQNEWTNRNVLAAYKGKIEAKPLIYLREAEIQAIQDLNLIDPSLEAVRDGFVFMCFTGVSFADLVKLQPCHLKLVNDVWCLEKPREKQKRNFRNTHFVPLLPVADAILKRYAAHCEKTGFLLPVKANQDFNDILKGIAIAAKIERIKVTTRVARTSFTTMMLNLGLDMEAVGSMVGHTTAETTRKYYAELHQETVLERVLAVFKKK